MAASARSWATMLVLALAFSLASATGAHAQTAPGGCGTPATPATPADPTPGVPGATPATPAIPADPERCGPGPDGVLGTADDVVLSAGFDNDDLPLRADTGAGGMAGGDSSSVLLLVGGGLLALGAAFGLRRTARGGKS